MANIPRENLGMPVAECWTPVGFAGAEDGGGSGDNQNSTWGSEWMSRV